MSFVYTPSFHGTANVYFIVKLTKSLLKLGYGWIITSCRKPFLWLLTHTIIEVDRPTSKRGKILAGAYRVNIGEHIKRTGVPKYKITHITNIYFIGEENYIEYLYKKNKFIKTPI